MGFNVVDPNERNSIDFVVPSNERKGYALFRDDDPSLLPGTEEYIYMI